VGPKSNKQTKSRKEQIFTMKEKINQSTNIFSLQSFHPKCAQSRLVSEAKQDQAWLVLGWETNLQKRLLGDKQFRDKAGMPSKFKWSHSCQTSQK
jgi:hypothetical protein